MFPYSILEYVVRCKLMEDGNRILDEDNEERRRSLHESRYSNFEKKRSSIELIVLPSKILHRNRLLLSIESSQWSRLMFRRVLPKDLHLPYAMTMEGQTMNLRYWLHLKCPKRDEEMKNERDSKQEAINSI